MIESKKLSVVVPCYRDEENIEPLLQRLITTLQNTVKDWEIIYVNDASPDNSQQILEAQARKDRRIKLIKFSRNFGVMSAFRAGLDYATGDAVVIMDGDLQDPPEVISDFVAEWQKGYFVVYGHRKTRDESRFRKIGYKLFYPLWRWLSDFDIPVGAGEFALIDRKVVDIIKNINERELFLRGIRGWVGFPQIGVDYHRPNRHAGESTQSLLSYFNWATKAISSFSVVPLKLISLMVLVAFLFILFMMFVKLGVVLQGVDAPPGFFTIIFTVLGIGAVQLLALSIIAEYVIHIFTEVKARPKYIVERQVNIETPDDN